MLEQIAALFGAKKIVMVLGLLGALVSLRFVPAESTNSQRVVFLLCGLAFAVGVAPSLGEWMALPPRIEGGLAFSLGVFGMNLAGAANKAIGEVKLAEKIDGWLKRPGS